MSQKTTPISNLYAAGQSLSCKNDALHTKQRQYHTTPPTVQLLYSACKVFINRKRICDRVVFSFRALKNMRTTARHLVRGCSEGMGVHGKFPKGNTPDPFQVYQLYSLARVIYAATEMQAIRRHGNDRKYRLNIWPGW